MDSFYEILVHYDVGVSPIVLTMNILEHWSFSSRLALQVFPKSGEGEIPSKVFLEKRFQYRGEQDVSIRLKTSRKRDADYIEFYFTNPDWKISSLNYCQVGFDTKKVKGSLPGYSFSDILELFSVLVEDESTKFGFVGISDITYYPEFVNVDRLLAQKRGIGNWPYEINWMTYLSRSAMSNLKDQKLLAASGLIVLRTFADGSCIVWSGDHPDTDLDTQKDNLFKIMRNLGLIT